MLVDFELIQRARSGDDVAFNQVVQAYRKRILGTISRLLGRPEDVAHAIDYLTSERAGFDSPVGTIKRRLHVARKRLAKHLSALAPA